MTSSSQNTQQSSQRTTPHTTALITGANKGIGFETARQLGALGWIVWVGARDADLGREAAEKLRAEGADTRFVQLDVTTDESVATAVKTITAAGTGLDVLVNNAGIGGGWLAPDETTPADFLGVYGVNVLGPVRVTHAFLPLLRQSQHARIVNVSSGMGSFAVTTDATRLESTLHGLVYPSSKAALNMITSQYAKALAPIKVNAVDPGYTSTDLNNHSGTQTVEQGAASTVIAATIGEDGPTGTFLGADGPIAW